MMTNGHKVVAGALGVGVIFGLAACSASAYPADPAPTAQVEQTIAPPAEDGAWVETEYGFVVPDGIAFPADAEDGYEFSAEPQGRAEQWLFDYNRDLWDRGVRSLSQYVTVYGATQGDIRGPAVLVQYVDGVRYEGTETWPVLFNSETLDPSSYPADWYDINMDMAHNPQQVAQPDVAYGQNGYRMFIKEDIGPRGGEGGATIIVSSPSTGVSAEMTQRFPDWQDAWAYVQENGFTVEGDGGRTLFPGEFTSVGASDQGANVGDGSRSLRYNPSTGQFDVAATFG